jgi:RNA polymerase sigma factor (sigma-70 family)
VIECLRRAVLLRDGTQATDGHLLERFLGQRDEGAFAALVHRHAPMVWGVCRRILGSHHDAEDAFQATFLVLLRKAAAVRPRELVGNWLYGVAHRTALAARSGRARRQGRERQVAAMPEPAAAAPDLWRDLQPLLDQELTRLPEKYRAAIVLCDLGGRTRQEAARQLGVPEGTLSGRLSRGRALLAKRLARHGVPVSGAALAVAMSDPAATAAAPGALVSATVETVGLCVTGQTASAIPARVAALVEGVLKAMLLSKLKIIAAVVLAIGVLGTTAVGWLGSPTWADEEAAQPAQPQEPAPRVKGDAPGADAKVDTAVFPLKNATATDLAKTLRELLGKDGDALAIVADPASNSLLARGRRDQLERVEALIIRLDDATQPVDAPKDAQKRKDAGRDPRIETAVLRLRHTKAVEMAKTLQELLQSRDADALRIAADPGSNSVVARGRRDQLELVEVLITRLEDAAVERQALDREEAEKLRAIEAKQRLQDQEALQREAEDNRTKNAQPSGRPATVTIYQGKREIGFSPGRSTHLEGLALAVLGTSKVANQVTKDEWTEALRGDHFRIVYAEPRAVGVSTGDSSLVLLVFEIVLPVSAEEPPMSILVRCGDGYRGFAKHQPQEAKLLQNLLRSAQAP